MPSLKTSPDARPYALGRDSCDPHVMDRAVGLFPKLAGFDPDPRQWEMDLGDRLPLQPGRARTERSEGGRGPDAASSPDLSTNSQGQ